MTLKFNDASPSFVTPCHLICRVLLLLLITLSLSAETIAAQNAGEEMALEPGRPITRQFAGEKLHTYQLRLFAGQYLHVVVKQLDVDVVVMLSGAGGRQLAAVDGLKGTQGSEAIFFIAMTDGTYHLEVQPLNMSPAAGRYEVRIEELRTAKAVDKQRTKAETLFAEATLLLNNGAAESLNIALGKFKDAVPLFQALKDAPREVAVLNSIGLILFSSDQSREALESFTRALSLARATGARDGEALALVGLGSTLLYGNGEMQRALESFGQALTIYRALGDRAGEATALASLGFVYLNLGDMPKALESLTKALPLLSSAGAHDLEAASLLALGYVFLATGEMEKASEAFTQTLPAARAAGNRQGEAIALAVLGYFRNNARKPREALELLSQAHTLFRAINDPGGQALVLIGLGLAYAQLADKEKALDSFTQALPYARAAGDRINESMALTGISIVNIMSGETQKALDNLTQAVALARAARDKQSEANALIFLGFAYGRLGDTQKAVDTLTQALLLLHAVGDRDGETVAHIFIGFSYLRSGERQKAHASFARALPLAGEIGDRGLEIHALNGLGLANLSGARESLNYLTQALPSASDAGNRANQADTLNGLGLIHLLSGSTEQALDSFKRSLHLYRQFGDRQGEATALLNLAFVEMVEDELSDARAHTEAAIAILESLRTNIVNQELRSTYFSTAQDYYDFYIDLLMRLHEENPSAGHDAEALQASERARARALLETLAEANADIRQGVDPKLVERERSIQRRLNAKAQDQMKLLNGSHTDEEAAAVAKEVEALTSEFQQAETEIRQTSPRYAALTQPQPLLLKEIQAQVLDPDTILLEYKLGKERSHLWAVTTTTITSYELPRRVEIETAARQFYGLIREQPLEEASTVPAGSGIGAEARRQPGAEIAQAAAQLSRMLLAPAAPLLGKKRLLIVGDGALQYIPFAALPVPTIGGAIAAPTPLIVEHEIVNLPSASTIAVLRREMGGRALATKMLAVVADPVFDKKDERLKKYAGQTETRHAGPAASKDESKSLDLAVTASAKQSGVADDGLEIPRLPGTRREAKVIVKLVPPSQYKEALDFAASRATVTGSDVGQYRYVHFATHGFLNSQTPELSGLVLSLYDEQGQQQDGFLRAHEIFNLKLAADLVVLSACQTGLGKDIRGEGLISLTRGFMYAGAPRVVVSLWNVDDEATAELMARFYRGVLIEKLRPARALQTAQLSLLQENRWAQPYYWAAFSLQGEWR